MKSALLFTLLLASSLTQASDLNLTCQASHNLDVIFERSFTLGDLKRNVRIGNFNEFEVFISSMGGDKVELQVLNQSDAMRSYALGRLRTVSDEVQLLTWKNDYMFDVVCERVQ